MMADSAFAGFASEDGVTFMAHAADTLFGDFADEIVSAGGFGGHGEVSGIERFQRKRGARFAAWSSGGDG